MIADAISWSKVQERGVKEDEMRRDKLFITNEYDAKKKRTVNALCTLSRRNHFLNTRHRISLDRPSELTNFLETD